MSEDPNLPMGVLERAIRAVPQLRYALGVAGLAGALAIILGFVRDFRIAIIGILALIVIMVLLVVFVRIADQPHSELLLPARVLTWFAVTALIAVCVLFISSIFYGKPRDLGGFLGLHSEKPTTPTVVTPTSVTQPVQPAPGANHGPLEREKTAVTPRQPMTQRSPRKSGNNSEADVWEHRGDIAALAAIQAEIAVHEKYDPVWDATHNLSTPFEEITQHWDQANYDWQEALKRATDSQRILRLKDKLDHKKRKTCEQQDTPATTTCYVNGTDYDVVNVKGIEKSVHLTRK